MDLSTFLHIQEEKYNFSSLKDLCQWSTLSGIELDIYKKKTSISLYTCTSQVLVSSNTCNTAIESHLNERNLEAMQVWDYTTEDYLKELRVNSHFHPWMCRVWTISSPKDGNSSFSYWKWKSVTNSSIC